MFEPIIQTVELGKDGLSLGGFEWLVAIVAVLILIFGLAKKG